jgi:hypothetical protein
MSFYKFSWKNIEISMFVFLPVQMWDSSLFHALSWIFMKKYRTFKVHSFLISDLIFKYYSCAFMNFHEKYRTFKVHSFPSSDVRFKYFSCAFMNFHEKYRTFKVHSFPSSDVRFKYFSCVSWIFLKKYWILKIQNFPSSDVRFNAFSCTFISFHEKILNSKRSPFFKFRCEIQWIFMHFHQFSWKNIEFLKVHHFPSSDVRFNAFACTFISFNEKILNSESSPFSKFRCEIQCICMHFHQF